MVLSEYEALIKYSKTSDGHVLYKQCSYWSMKHINSLKIGGWNTLAYSRNILSIPYSTFERLYCKYIVIFVHIEFLVR